MKRIEMVNIMLDTAKYHDGAHLEPYAAHSILKALEDSGMLPPNNEKTIAIKKSSVPCVMRAINCHEWESEDEI